VFRGTTTAARSRSWKRCARLDMEIPPCAHILGCGSKASQRSSESPEPGRRSSPAKTFTNSKQDVSVALVGRRLRRMGIFQKCKLVVRENDFVEVRRSKDGSAAWFRNPKAGMRFCIDGITNSATVFWAIGPSQLSSKTFRTVASLQDWLAMPAERQVQTMERLI